MLEDASGTVTAELGGSESGHARDLVGEMGLIREARVHGDGGERQIRSGRQQIRGVPDSEEPDRPLRRHADVASEMRPQATFAPADFHSQCSDTDSAVGRSHDGPGMFDVARDRVGLLQPATEEGGCQTKSLGPVWSDLEPLVDRRTSGAEHRTSYNRPANSCAGTPTTRAAQTGSDPPAARERRPRNRIRPRGTNRHRVNSAPRSTPIVVRNPGFADC